MIAANPAAQVERRKIAKSDGHTPWTDADLEQYRAKWPVGTQQRLALEVLQWTGARMSDAVTFNDAMIKDGWLHYRQQKTGGLVRIPITAPAPIWSGPEGQKHLQAALAVKPGALWMPTEFGKQRSGKAASAWFAEAAREAGVMGKSAHGLRKYRLTTMAERKATTHQMAAWCGHKSLKEVADYSAEADRKRVIEDDMVPTANTGFQL